MKTQLQRTGAVTVVRPDGPIIGDDADRFKTEVLGAIHENLGRVIIDASCLTYVDSRGLEVLLEATEYLAHSGQTLKLCALNKTVRQVLELTGLSSQFEYYDDTNTAIRSFLV